jgi:alkanesulfonate monooxygenase SsuD/methylene tetrahydromethanopterin reductase-like flavin-dependent oxidoreductase (luciferase family)
MMKDLEFGILSLNDFYPSGVCSESEFLAQILDQATLADKLGFSLFFIQEHHFHSARRASRFGIVPNPALLLASAARLTNRIRLGPAVAVLPLNDPLRIAEDYAIVDQLSHGRLVFGVGSGYRDYEFEGWGIPLSEKRDRFDEALAVVELAWKGGRFSYEGRFFRYRNVILNTSTLQKKVEVWVAALRLEAVLAILRTGRKPMIAPYSTFEGHAALSRFLSRVRNAPKKSRARHISGPLSLTFPTHVCQDATRAEHEASRPIRRYLGAPMLAEKFARKRLGQGTRTVEDWKRSRLVWIGGPEEVAAEAVRAARLGATQILTIHNFGGFDAEAVASSMKLFAEEVIPRVKEAGVRVASN